MDAGERADATVHLGPDHRYHGVDPPPLVRVTSDSFEEAALSDDELASPPATIGELRERLDRLGRPWTAPARFGNDDPLPDPPRGGQPVEAGHVDGLRAVDSPEELTALLAEHPPANPFLAARWRELGVAVAVVDAGPAADVVEPGSDMPEWGVG
jgi:hypothetical protein